MKTKDTVISPKILENNTHPPGNRQNGESMVQTLIIKHNTDTGKNSRLRVVAGDCVDEVNSAPSKSYDGENFYTIGVLIVASHRRSKWYKSAQFDDAGNSDWLV